MTTNKKVVKTGEKKTVIENNKVENKVLNNPKPVLLKEYGEIRNSMAKEKQRNIHSIPKLTKIVITSCLGEYCRDEKKFNMFKEDIRKVFLQEPLVVRAKKSVARFYLRQGMPIAYKATLRGERMLHFVHRLIYCGWLNDRNFEGVSTKAIIGSKKSGYSLNGGMKDISFFPEVQKVLDKYVGIGFTISTNARSKEECVELLTKLQFPFIEDLSKNKEKEK